MPRFKWVYIPFDVATTLRDGQVYTDRYWQCIPGEGGGIVFAYFGRGHYSPQCNHDKRIVERMAEENEFEVRHLPAAYLGWTDEEGRFRGLPKLVREVKSDS